MSTLARQQCFHHPGREAAARCPACKKDFCRECVTEHDGRYLCLACIRLETAAARSPASRRFLPANLLLSVSGLLCAGLVYYALTNYLILNHSAENSYRSWHGH